MQLCQNTLWEMLSYQSFPSQLRTQLRSYICTYLLRKIMVRRLIDSIVEFPIAEAKTQLLATQPLLRKYRMNVMYPLVYCLLGLISPPFKVPCQLRTYAFLRISIHTQPLNPVSQEAIMQKASYDGHGALIADLGFDYHNVIHCLISKWWIQITQLL